MCLTGVDYFSTLAYQPSIAFENAGLLAPFATIVLVSVTLFGALPLYRYVAGKSAQGQGSIGMLAGLLSGWPGKILVLTLLGFAATDFVITKTLSSADAAEQLIQNPHWPLEHSDQSRRSPANRRDDGAARPPRAMFMRLPRGYRHRGRVGRLVPDPERHRDFVRAHVPDSHPERVQAWLERVNAGQWYLEHTPVSGSGVGSIVLISLLFFPRWPLGFERVRNGRDRDASFKADRMTIPRTTRANPQHATAADYGGCDHVVLLARLFASRCHDDRADGTRQSRARRHAP